MSEYEHRMRRHTETSRPREPSLPRAGRTQVGSNVMKLGGSCRTVGDQSNGFQSASIRATGKYPAALFYPEFSVAPPIGQTRTAIHPARELRRCKFLGGKIQSREQNG